MSLLQIAGMKVHPVPVGQQLLDQPAVTHQMTDAAP
jgi:hypothetical protein